MVSRNYGIDSESTAEAFARYGGPRAWVEAKNHYQPPAKEKYQCHNLCLVGVVITAQDKLIGSGEEQAIYQTIAGGLGFGLKLLAYNFMIKREVLDQKLVDLAMEYVSDRCEEFLVAMEPAAASAANQPDLPGFLGMGGQIEGFMPLIDSAIDELCPTLDNQYEFRLGALMAQSVFAGAIGLLEGIRQEQADQLFQEMLDFNQIDFEI